MQLVKGLLLPVVDHEHVVVVEVHGVAHEDLQYPVLGMYIV